MKRWLMIGLGLLSFGVTAVLLPNASSGQNAGWITLFDGSSLDNWDAIGDANWRVEDGVAQADMGRGFLVSKDSYADFELKVEFWVDDDANSGVFLRCANRQEVGPSTSYEVNIFDKRPDPSYATGAIVNIAKVAASHQTSGKWNVFEISAKGPHIVITLNGVTTVDVQISTHARGPIALQYGAGVVKFRNVQIMPL